MDIERPEAVVKVGGSLYDLPNLGSHVRHLLTGLGGRQLIVVPGGGVAADVVRAWDRRHGLGEEKAHWLALASLSLTGRFLAEVVPGCRFVTEAADITTAWDGGHVAVLDPWSFARQDEGQPGCLPHQWTATSDAVAARVAQVFQARRLVMVKSVPLPDGMTWPEAARQGLVDEVFAQIVVKGNYQVEWRTREQLARE